MTADIRDDRQIEEDASAASVSGATHAVALTQDDLERMLSRAIEDTRGGGWGALFIGCLLLLLGLSLGSLVVRDRISDGTADLRAETAALRDEVARLTEIAMTPRVVTTSVQPTIPSVAEKVSLAQRAEAASTQDHVFELAERRARLDAERERVRTELRTLAADGRMLEAETVSKVMDSFFSRQLAWIDSEREQATALSERQQSISEAVLDQTEGDEAFLKPLHERIEKMLPPPTANDVATETENTEAEKPAVDSSATPPNGLQTRPTPLPLMTAPKRAAETTPTPNSASPRNTTGSRGVSIQTGRPSKTPVKSPDGEKEKSKPVQGKPMFDVPDRGRNTTFAPGRKSSPKVAPNPFKFASEGRPIGD